MILDDHAFDYLTGKRFSNGSHFKIAPQHRLVRRNNRLMELARGKTVLHIGCADHEALIEEKIKQGTYLHTLLASVTEELYGVDIDAAGIDKMISLGIRNVFTIGNVPRMRFELLIVSDVIEHIPDVTSFLRDLHSYDFQTVVVTTPNAFRLRNRLQFGAELVNTDHHYWFSPYTLARVLVDAGYQLTSMEFTDKTSRRNFIRNGILCRYPLLQNGLLATATPSGPSPNAS